MSSREGRGGELRAGLMGQHQLSRAENGRRQDSDWTSPAPKTETGKCGGKKMTRNAELLARESCDYFIIIFVLVMKCSEILTQVI